jgi:hypothetical protein
MSTEPIDGELGDALELMTADELARALRVSTAWIYTQTRNDSIPHITLGRYRRATILDWLQENEGSTR